MTNKEKEMLKNEIAMKDVMTRKIGKWCKYSFLAFLLFGAVTFWGFSGMTDRFLNVSQSMRDILKWVGLVLAIPCGLFTVLTFVSFKNSKKHVIALIDKLANK